MSPFLVTLFLLLALWFALQSAPRISLVSENDLPPLVLVFYVSASVLMATLACWLYIERL